jgi:hypothetical protein
MHEFTKYDRTPQDILGLANSASIEDIQIAYDSCKAKLEKGFTMDDLGAIASSTSNFVPSMKMPPFQPYYCPA